MLIRPKSVLKGVGSFAIDKFRASGAGDAGVNDANGSYAIFMRYLLALARMGTSFENKVVVEFGPGSSFGIGFAALLCGAKRYYAFDVVDHTSDDRNIRIFDSLADMFKNQSKISIDGFCARIFPFLEDYNFPTNLLPEDLLKRTLEPGRIADIRKDLRDAEDNYIRPRSSANIRAGSIDEKADIILSESVLEHVDDLEATYDFFRRSLAPNGAMVHLIDYSSHKLSPTWNGHWGCSSFLWSLVRGKRHYLVNRMPHQVHLDLLHANGLKVCDTELLRRVDGLTRDQFSPEFRSMSYRDSTTALVSITCCWENS